jgi:protein SCO1/2
MNMDKNIRKVGLGLLLLIGVVSVLVMVFRQPENLNGAVLDPALPAPDFSLVREDGTEFRLSAYRGKIVLLYFGYTSCPDVCPATMAELRQAREALSSGLADQVQVVIVAVDPDRDTPERIQQYAEHFDESFTGLSGSLGELQQIWDAYGITRTIEESRSASGYLVSHTARVYLVDKTGNLRLSFAFGTPPEDITHDLRLLLEE